MLKRISLICLLLLLLLMCDFTSNLTIVNNSHVDLLFFEVVNNKVEEYNRGFAASLSEGSFIWINIDLDRYIREKGEVELIVIENFKLKNGEEYENLINQKKIKILARIIISEKTLDSLGGKLIYPKDFTLLK